MFALNSNMIKKIISTAPVSLDRCHGNTIVIYSGGNYFKADYDNLMYHMTISNSYIAYHLCFTLI